MNSHDGSEDIGFLERQITRAFQRLVDLELKDHGIDPIPMPDWSREAPPQLRYAPMRRLLVSEDEFLSGRGLSSRLIEELRRSHLRCYFLFLSELRKEIRHSRLQELRTMDIAERWDLQPWIMRAFRSESALVNLAWFGWKARCGLSINAKLLCEALDSLLAVGISHPEALLRS